MQRLRQQPLAFHRDDCSPPAASTTTTDDVVVVSAASSPLPQRQPRQPRQQRRRIVQAVSTSSLFLFVLLLVLSFWLCGTVVVSLPIQIEVESRHMECLYDTLKEKEAVTMELWILVGDELKATAKLEGPLVGVDATAAELLRASKEFPKNHQPVDIGRGKLMMHSEVVDFEHLNMADEYDDDDEEDDDEVIEQRKLATQRRANETDEQRKARVEAVRKHTLEVVQRKHRQQARQRQLVREEGDPYEKTVRAPAAGWYRFCVLAPATQVHVELEIRKESELGGFNEEDEENGEPEHVWTWEQRVMELEDRWMERDTAAEEGIKDEDFVHSRDKLKALRRLLAEIQNKQQQERRALQVHTETNEHSHSRMVLNSLMETVLFMGITGFQVYTIRRWFKGSPILAR